MSYSYYMTWFYLSLLVLLFYGIKDFLLKVGVQGKCSESIIMLSFCMSVCVIATTVFIGEGGEMSLTPEVFLLAFGNGILSLCVNVFRYTSLKYIPATVAYPLFDMSVVVIVFSSLLFLHENLNVYQYIGMILIILSTQLISRRLPSEKKKYRNYALGMFFIICSLICASITPFLIKRAVSLDVNIAFFIALCYFFSSSSIALLFLTRRRFSTGKHIHKQHHAHSLLYGIMIGIFNFLGFYAYMHALRLGTVALVSVISSLSVVILVLLSGLLYKDRLTNQRSIGIIIGLISLILLKL